MTDLMPTFRYVDAPAAIDWLCDAFGFERVTVLPGPDGAIAHAELRHGDAVIAINSAPAGFATTDTADFRFVPCSVYLRVSDVDEHCATASAAGAGITMPPTDMPYGSREYSARDPEGHHWHFGSYVPGTA
ncbi:hypothetical protein Athai_36910 [Actinocatenispora thailandica]|uniref:VOC domain-containing protein n=1 Tax=Actinocatenispora thailandica TaxID=227318 RepID=A0A7R7HYM3_9ACTN|nr:VOC family protein [Actinocatenispora thailandica]BCJ36188.1 hypothetical protein Athai_36910 [Actinocatenispora thailandica]